MKKVLFIVKCRGMAYEQTENTVLVPHDKTKSYCLSSGLFNSAKFMADMLAEQCIESKLVQVIDNNDIDREVTKFRPTHVIIEALWVVPEKFEVLKRLHPDVKWIIRLHSETPFISGEGNAMDWIFRYLKYSKVYIAPNTERMYNDLKNLTETKYNSWIAKKRIIYLPNFYKSDFKYGYNPKNTLDIGCFGSLRPLKNQLIQAMAAVEYAKQTKQRLKYHINSGRIEHGNNVLKNIRALFEHLDSTRFELVEHDWLSHTKFLQLVRRMDICLQVSFSETHNIVTCDAVSQGVPVVVSDEIFWVSSLFHANTNSITSIVCKIKLAMFLGKFGAYLNALGIKKYNKKSIKLWKKMLKMT